VSDDVKLKENVNEIIKRKLTESKISENVRDFINDILYLELEHLDERAAWWGHLTEYEKIVKKHSQKKGVESS
jgi:hypothetical protein